MPSYPQEGPACKPSLMRRMPSAVIVIEDISLMLEITSKAPKRSDSWVNTSAKKAFNGMGISESGRQEPSCAKIIEYVFDGLG